jgi:hypothetical protein
MALPRDEFPHRRQRLAHQAICQVEAKSGCLGEVKALSRQRQRTRKLGAMEANIPQATKDV